MKMKEGTGWKACHNDERGVYGAEVMFQGSWDLYEITGEVFARLSSKLSSGEAERLITSGRRLYTHVNDRCGPPYTIVFDDDYAVYCPWMGNSAPAGKTWSKELTDAAVELFDSEKPNREQRKKHRDATNDASS